MKKQNKTFIFLYPQQEIFDYEIDRGSVFYKDPKSSEFDAHFLPRLELAKTEKEKEQIRVEARRVRADSFKPYYSEKLNSCIHYRYRLNGFSVVYALLDDSQVADVIQVRSTDRVIHVGMDSKTHRTKGSDGQYPYPDQDHIINQLLPVEILRIGGFHAWDCVERLARRAYERGINVLVDEDLTEFFAGRLKDRDFRVKSYPTYDARKHQKSMFDMFMEARKNKPWLWQDY
jgi:hypothetical protein